MTRYHLSVSREYLLEAITRDGAAKVLDGWPGSDEAALAAVRAMDADYVPIGPCDNRDSSGRCNGHDEPKEPKVTLEVVEAFAKRCEAVDNEHREKHYPRTTPSIFEVMEGKRYFRVVSAEKDRDGSYVHRSAYCFVDKKDGNIYKPASWKGPTKNFPRGNVFDDKAGMGWARPFGIATVR